MDTPNLLLTASLASVATFSYALATPRDSVSRYGAVGLLAGLQYPLVTYSHKLSEHGDAPFLFTSLSVMLFFHAVDYLIVLKASSEGSFVGKYVATPLGLLCNWRRLGTQWQISKIPPFSRHDPTYTPSRFVLIAQRLLYIAAALVVIDLCAIASVDMSDMISKRALLSRLDEVTGDELLLRAALLLSYTLNGIVGIYIGYAAITIVALLLGCPVAQCPPMFGSLGDAYTVRGYWGDFYHQGLRRAITGPSDYFVDNVLRLPRGFVSRYLRLTLAFAISGLVHGFAEASAGVPPHERGNFFFFTSCAFAIMAEDAVQYLYKRTAKLPAFVERAIGYVWVVAWMFLMEPYFAFPLIKYAEERPSQLRPLLTGLFDKST